jgi:hypothetical protein
MFRLIILFILSSSAFAQVLPWGLNDLSVLFPLPESLENNTLMSPKSGLLPYSMYKPLPKLADFEDQDGLFKTLSVVALRIDPGTNEIRMVYQPIELSRFPFEEGILAKDMAIHVFYQLTAVELKTFLEEYQALKVKFKIVSSAVPEVNKAMTGSYGDAFKALAIKSTGEKRISKVTFMRLESIGGIWAFGGFNVKDGVMTRFNIPRVKKDLQMFTNVGRGRFMSSRMTPAPQGKDTFNQVIEAMVKDASQAETLIKEVKAAYRVEDPKIHTVDTMDCVSCHTAMLVRHWSFETFPEVLAKETWPETESTKGLTLNNLRAFGYHDSRPTINQRTVNETRQIVSKLNAAASSSPSHPSSKFYQF